METFTLPIMLAALRQRSGLSQSDLARKMDISPAAVSQAERASHPLRENTFAEYTKALGYSTELDALVNGVAELQHREAERIRLEAQRRRASTPRKRRTRANAS